MSAWTPDRAELIEAAVEAFCAIQPKIAPAGWSFRIAKAVDAVESALRAQIEAEYEQVGSYCTTHGAFAHASNEIRSDCVWKPVYRRVAEIGAT